MNRIFTSAPIRRTATVVAAAFGLLATVSPAFACLDLCIEKFGPVFWEPSLGRYVELDYCTQRFNDAGGVSTMCYYSTF